MTKFTSAIEKAQIDIVPKTVVTMGGSEQNSTANAFEMLLNLLISDKLGVKLNSDSEEADPRTKAIKEQIMKNLAQTAAEESKTEDAK
jgi:hypothetical protein